MMPPPPPVVQLSSKGKWLSVTIVAPVQSAKQVRARTGDRAAGGEGAASLSRGRTGRREAVRDRGEGGSAAASRGERAGARPIMIPSRATAAPPLKSRDRFRTGVAKGVRVLREAPRRPASQNGALSFEAALCAAETRSSAIAPRRAVGRSILGRRVRCAHPGGAQQQQQYDKTSAGVV